MEETNQGWGEAQGWGDANETLNWIPSIPESFQVDRQKCEKNNIHLENAMFDSNVRVLFSCPESWELFLNELPAVVAIDCEGTTDRKITNSTFPKMIQISNNKFVIIEFPSDYKDRDGIPSLSPYLSKLLDDPGVTKVFFDPTGLDKKMLNQTCLPSCDILTLLIENEFQKTLYEHDMKIMQQQSYNTNNEKNEKLKKTIIKKFQNFGLINIISHATGQIYEKNSIKKQNWWGLNSSTSMKLHKKFVNYAAADAWGTFLAFTFLEKEKKKLFEMKNNKSVNSSSVFMFDDNNNNNNNNTNAFVNFDSNNNNNSNNTKNGSEKAEN
jgi:hypothetical protein